jgi:hypothetical protein
MPKFRKKPIVIDAWLFLPVLGYQGWGHETPPNWVGKEAVFTLDVDGIPIVEIETPEGTMTANGGDWIIKGVEDELYPCKGSVFSATYTPVDGTVGALTDEEDAILSSMASTIFNIQCMTVAILTKKEAQLARDAGDDLAADVLTAYADRLARPNGLKEKMI